MNDFIFNVLLFFQLIDDYLMDRSDKKLQTVACRLVLDILPGIEISVVFNDTVRMEEMMQFF